MFEPELVYEDGNFIAVNKPAGLLVHATSDKRQAMSDTEPTLVDWLLQKYPEVKTIGDDPEERPGIVHRLDRDTSGIMVVARTQSYFEYLKKLFHTREVTKTYLALVRGSVRVERGTIDAPIGILSGSTKRSVRSEKMKKEAVTEYRVRERFGNGSAASTLLEVMPKTGRTHQIRVHLASIGHPVIGDRLYGSRVRLGASAVRARKRQEPGANIPRLMLHAYSLEFAAYAGTRVHIRALLPPDFEETLQKLEEDGNNATMRGGSRLVY